MANVAEIFAELKCRPLPEAFECVGRLVAPHVRATVCTACGGSGELAHPAKGDITASEARLLIDDLIHEALNG